MKYIFSFLFLFNVALFGVDGRMKQAPSSPDPFQRKAMFRSAPAVPQINQPEDHKAKAALEIRVTLWGG